MITEFGWRTNVENFGINREELDKVVEKEQKDKVDPEEQRKNKKMREASDISSETSQGSSEIKLKRKNKLSKQVKPKKVFLGESKYYKKKQLRKEKRLEKQKFLERIKSRKEQQGEVSG